VTNLPYLIALAALLGLLLPASVVGQTFVPVKSNPDVEINWTDETITLDGKLLETCWQRADTAGAFVQCFPYDTSFARSRTVVRLVYNKQFIYISAICYDTLPDVPYVVTSLRRDFSYPRSDAFAVYFNPTNDKNNGFNFTVSPYGVQREGLIENGGGQGVTTAWDNKWFSAVSQEPYGWVVEMAIPFKTLRYNQHIDVWSLQFSRNNLKINEGSVWSPLPRIFNTATLVYAGNLKWDAIPPKSGLNIALIPYLTAGLSHNYQAGQLNPIEPGGGLDAKVAITSALNLDLTVNPDFSQVEVDAQVINLDRFSIFFPERRNFFIENGDLFASFGFSRIRPFFSRQIGLYNGQRVPILGGFRLSGKLDQNWRIGVMNLQTEGMRELGLNAQNYTVLAVQRQVFKYSNLAFIAVNRQGFNGLSPQGADYNRVVGLDYNLYTKDNKWRGKLFYHQSFSPEARPGAYATAMWLMYSVRNMSLHYNHEVVGSGYSAEVGFVPRSAYVRFEPLAEFYFYPKSKWAQYHGPYFYVDNYYTLDMKITDGRYNIGYDFVFLNTSSIELYYNEYFTQLTFEWDPTNTGSVQLPLGGYHYRNAGAVFRSDYRKRLTYEIRGLVGTYFNGNRWSVNGEVNYRFQPWGTVGVAFNQNSIRLPQPYAQANLTLVSPKFDVTFTKSLFFTLFLQYNSQINNLNLNARLQWRFKPMSDLYIVVTDNYLDDPLAIKTRAVVVKLNYWFGL